MIHTWLCAIAHKIIPNHPLRQFGRHKSRRARVLRVEVLEDRSVPSGLSDAVDAVVWASLSDGVSITSASVSITLGGDSVSPTGISVSGFSGPGLDRLIQALQQLASSPSLPPETTSTTTFLTPPPTPPSIPAVVATPDGSPDQGVVPDVRDAVAAVAQSFTLTVITSNSPPAQVPRGPGTNGATDPAASAVPDPTPVRQAASPPLPDGRAAPAASNTPPSLAPPGTGVAALSPTSPAGVGVATGTSAETAAQAAYIVVHSTDVFPQAGAGSAGVVPAAPAGGPAGARSPLGELTDGSLLQLFAAGREQAAFTTLVRRYEPSVLRVCTQVLGDADRARDASQATFQALARRAGALDGQAPLRGWLSTVAYHLALRYRVADTRRRQLERTVAARSTGETADTTADIEEEELRGVVGEELDRLPAKYRTPLVLHYLDGRTHAEVAREVGLPRGSVARRIGEGLGLLRDRLVARGIPF